MISNNKLSKNSFLGIIVLLLVGGDVAIAVIDSSTRPAFIDLSKIALGAYLGLLIPKAVTRVDE